MNQPSLIIVGAGASGLIAAKELAPIYNIRVLEAQPRIGGRIHSITIDDHIIEAGAEFVHGNLPLTQALLKEAGIEYVKVEGKMYRKKNGHLSSVHEMTVDWDGLLEKMNSIEEDMTVQEFLQQFYKGEEHEQLRRQVQSYTEGFDVADITRASVKALYKEWSAEDEDNYRVPTGYDALIQYLKNQAEEKGTVIYTNTCAKRVHWQEGGVTVYTADGKEFHADKLLVTVPVSVLQQPTANAFINFDPPLLFNETLAINIGYGAVIKLVLKFRNIFWEKDTGFVLSDELFPTWWTQLPDKVPVLTGWLGGPKAVAHSNDSDEELLEKGLASLSAIFKQPVETLRNQLTHYEVFNWQKNEFAMGAYSYSAIDSESARKIITEPVANTIFFAGEALYSGEHPGTVEAALVSGTTSANKIKLLA